MFHRAAMAPPSLVSQPFSLLPLAFHYACFVSIEASSPALLMHKLTVAADCVARDAQQHAMELQFVAGKTEAVTELRGRGKKACMLILAEHKTI